jgi:hypothetical protein
MLSILLLIIFLVVLGYVFLSPNLGLTSLGPPLLALPSWIAGVDIAKGVTDHSLCSALPPTSVQNLVALALFLVYAYCLFEGVLTCIVGLRKSRHGDHSILLRGFKVIAVGLVMAILLGLYVRGVYSDGLCH